MTHRDRAGDPSGHRPGRREAAGGVPDMSGRSSPVRRAGRRRCTSSSSSRPRWRKISSTATRPPNIIMRYWLSQRRDSRSPMSIPTPSRAKRLAPRIKKRGRDIVAPRRRRDLTVALDALHYDPKVLFQRPTSTASGLRDLQPLNRKTVLFISHKDSLADRHRLSPGGRHRRLTALLASPTLHSWG